VPDGQSLARTANAEAAKGWEVVEVVGEVSGNSAVTMTRFYMLFRRPADAKD
jgi:hypothetical protein